MRPLNLHSDGRRGYEGPGDVGYFRKFDGVPARAFYPHLKECEHRFKNRTKS